MSVQYHEDISVRQLDSNDGRVKKKKNKITGNFNSFVERSLNFSR